MLARHFAHLQIPALRAITSQGYSPSSDIHSPLALSSPPPSTCVQPRALPAGPQHHTAASSTQHRTGKDCVHLLLPITVAQTSLSSSLKQREEWWRSPEAMLLTQFKAKVGGWGAGDGNEKSVTTTSSQNLRK